MLNGIEPIIIFQLYKLTPNAETTLAKVPLTSGSKTKSTFAIIPIYLSESITGIFIESESKNIDVDTEQNSLSSGEGGPVNQKTLGSVTTITMKAKQGSVGLTILLALSELILDKVTSQEYEVTYMHKGVTIFGGLIHGFSYEQGTDDDLYRIKLELSRGRPKTLSVQVAEDPTAVRLGTSGVTPPASAPTVSGSASGGTSAITPGMRLP